MFRKFLIAVVIGTLFSVPIFAKAVLSVGGTHTDDTSYFGLNFYNFTETGLFLKTSYYTSPSNDWDAKFASLEIGYTGVRDKLPTTLFVGLTDYRFKPDQNEAADIVPQIGFWFGPTDSKWKVGASVGQQIFHDGSDPLYTQFSVLLFDFFYPRTTNYVVDLSVRFSKDKDTTFLWQFGTAF